MGISNSYLLKFAQKLVSNTIESHDMAEIRQDVVSDVRVLSSDIESHGSEVQRLRDYADSSILLPNGVWTNGIPGGLQSQALGLENHYGQLDKDAKLALFDRIYTADMSIAKSGVYEKCGSQILGRADLVNDRLADFLGEHFGTEYDDYAVGRLQRDEDAVNAGSYNDTCSRNHDELGYDGVPSYLSGVRKHVKPENTFDTFPKEYQDSFLERARAEWRRKEALRLGGYDSDSDAAATKDDSYSY